MERKRGVTLSLSLSLSCSEHRRKMKEAKMAASECPTSSREEKGFEITDEEKKRTTQLIYHFKEGREVRGRGGSEY